MVVIHRGQKTQHTGRDLAQTIANVWYTVEILCSTLRLATRFHLNLSGYESRVPATTDSLPYYRFTFWKHCKTRGPVYSDGHNTRLLLFNITLDKYMLTNFLKVVLTKIICNAVRQDFEEVRSLKA